MYGQPQQPGYGQPPQYGAPQAQPGYPQQQPNAHPGYPHQPGFPQQPGYPQAQQPPYGAPGGYPPPPRQKSNAGLVIGLVIGAVVLAGGGIGIWAATSGGGGKGSSTRATYKITTPQSLPGGYEQKTATSAPNDPSKGASACGATGTGVAASYSRSTTDNVLIIGCYGSISDPAAVIADYGKQATTTRTANGQTVGAKWVTPLTEMTSGETADPGGKLECGVLGPTSDPTGAAASPICVWADHSTFGQVSMISVPYIGGGKLTTSQVAEHTRKFRDAMVVPK